jgi:hypothetical protein
MVLDNVLRGLNLRHQAVERAPAHPFGFHDEAIDAVVVSKPTACLEGSAERTVTGSLAIWFRDARDLSVLASAVSRLAPQPRLVVISADLSFGHPLVREIGGQWVARVCSQWITTGAILRRDKDLDETTRLRLEAHGARDRDMLAEDIRSGRPDIILIHEDWLDWTKWALSDPGLADALSSYRRVNTVGDVAIWARTEKS